LRVVATILLRYCEIGLKSTPVRMKFENQLRDNILNMLVRDRVEAFVSHGDARFFIETEDTDRCVESLKKVFGLASLSVASVCTSELQDICRTAAEHSKGRISEGESFAVKARREGTHDYTSMDLGREAGSAIFTENEHLHVKVDLTKPDKVFYIEVRNNKAYVFDSYIQCPGGLPMGTQGKVIADIRNDRGIVSAWLMMKRGCRVLATGDYDFGILNEYDPALRVLSGSEAEGGYIRDVLARISGADLSSFIEDTEKFNVPVFHPTIGMTDSEVSKMLSDIENRSF